MRGDDNIAREDIAFVLHIDQFECTGQRSNGSIGIGNQADALRASTDATQLSHNTQRRSFAAQGMTAQARDNDFDKIGQAFFPFYRSNSNMLCAASL